MIRYKKKGSTSPYSYLPVPCLLSLSLVPVPCTLYPVPCPCPCPLSPVAVPVPVPYRCPLSAVAVRCPLSLSAVAVPVPVPVRCPVSVQGGKEVSRCTKMAPWRRRKGQGRPKTYLGEVSRRHGGLRRAAGLLSSSCGGRWCMLKKYQVRGGRRGRGGAPLRGTHRNRRSIALLTLSYTPLTSGPSLATSRRSGERGVSRGRSGTRRSG
jgi:hypothetical protein